MDQQPQNPLTNVPHSVVPLTVTQQKYNTARANLCMMLLLTVANIVMYFAGSDTMLLFSASLPYYGTVFGALYAEMGLMPLAVVLIAVAVISLVLYLLCWILSKKNVAWMIVALVLFSLDTLVLIGLHWLFHDMTGLFDVLIHVWVLIYLVIGVVNGFRLKKEVPPTENVPTEADASQTNE